MKRSVFVLIVAAIVVIAAFLVYSFFMTKPIKEIKSEKYLGEEVTVRGTVENTIKIGEISGYTLKDKNGDTIPVSSDNLPKEGTTKTTSGILRKGVLIGYYIEE